MGLDYIEKGAGLHEAIAAAGYQAYWRDGQFVTPNPTDEPLIQQIIDNFPMPDLLVETKITKCSQILAHSKMLRDRAVSAVSKGEIASWSIKRSEALLFQASGQASDCPMLAIEAQARNIALGSLVTKVLANSSRYSLLEATIGGVDGKHRDAVMALTTADEVMAYDYSAGWPGV